MSGRVFGARPKLKTLTEMAPKRPQRSKAKFPPRFWARAFCAECGEQFYVREKGAKCLDKMMDVWHCPDCASGQMELPGVGRHDDPK